MDCCCNKHSDLTLLDDVLSQYKNVKGSLITILQKAQDIYGYLPTDVIYHVASETGNTPAKVMGVATFYTQFRLQPVGKYLIMLCQGTACHVNGSERIEAAICEELGIKDGETTEDGMTLENTMTLDEGVIPQDGIKEIRFWVILVLFLLILTEWGVYYYEQY
jgi:NADH-quinone oxidoreductase subunit E